jgi:hypothetical protein
VRTDRPRRHRPFFSRPISGNPRLLLAHVFATFHFPVPARNGVVVDTGCRIYPYRMVFGRLSNERIGNRRVLGTQNRNPEKKSGEKEGEEFHASWPVNSRGRQKRCRCGLDAGISQDLLSRRRN